MYIGIKLAAASVRFCFGEYHVANETNADSKVQFGRADTEPVRADGSFSSRGKRTVFRAKKGNTRRRQLHVG